MPDLENKKDWSKPILVPAKRKPNKSGLTNWDWLQEQVTEFADKTFGNPGNPLPPLHHLKGEVDELIEAPNDIYEYADCMILLIQSAMRAGYRMNRLFDACEEKHEINKKRKWGEPDENGVVQHIKED